MADYAALKAEIAKPVYNGMNDAVLLATLNNATVTSAKPLLVKTTDIVNCFLLSDLLALTAIQLQALTILLSGGTVDASTGTLIRQNLQALFAGKPTLTNLAAIVSSYDGAKAPLASTFGIVGRPIDIGDLTQARVD